MTQREILTEMVTKRFFEDEGTFIEYVVDLIIMDDIHKKEFLGSYYSEKKSEAENSLAGIEARYTANKQAEQEKLQLEKATLEDMLSDKEITK